MAKDTLNTIIEGVIGLAVVLGVLFILYTRVSDQTVLVGILSGGFTAVLTFYFLRQQTTQVQNGTLKTLTEIAAQVSSGRDSAAETAGKQAESLVRATQAGAKAATDAAHAAAVDTEAKMQARG